MNNYTFWTFCAGIWCGAVLLAILSFAWPEVTTEYKAGQVDAINGKIIYHIVSQPDGTTRWEKK